MRYWTTSLELWSEVNEEGEAVKNSGAKEHAIEQFRDESDFLHPINEGTPLAMSINANEDGIGGRRDWGTKARDIAETNSTAREKI